MVKAATHDCQLPRYYRMHYLSPLVWMMDPVLVGLETAYQPMMLLTRL